MKIGDTVYHVENPTVRGVVVKEIYTRRDYVPTVGVIFDEPVNFSLSGNADKHKFWVCSHNLLYPTTEKAISGNKPELADPHGYVAFLREKFEAEKNIAAMSRYDRFVLALARYWNTLWGKI